jgi:hypothetical protein
MKQSANGIYMLGNLKNIYNKGGTVRVTKHVALSRYSFCNWNETKSSVCIFELHATTIWKYGVPYKNACMVNLCVWQEQKIGGISVKYVIFLLDCNPICTFLTHF